jgi:hypothetical protein
LRCTQNLPGRFQFSGKKPKPSAYHFSFRGYEGKERTSRSPRLLAPAIDWRRTGLILILFPCALASKEHSIMLPVLLLVTDLAWTSDKPTKVMRRNRRLYLPMLCGGLLAARAWLLDRND